MYDSGAGFDYFGPAHLGYLACSVVLIGVLCAAYRRLPSGTAWGSPRRTMQLVIAAIPLAMLASRDVMMYLAGVFDPNWWPLHSCNICELLMLVYALRPNRLCGESLATMGIFGALAALLFPSWSYCPPFTWPSVCGFTEHTLIVAFTAMVITGRDYEPSVKHIWMPLVLFGLYAPAAYAFNKAFDTNFMFLNAPPAARATSCRSSWSSSHAGWRSMRCGACCCIAQSKTAAPITRKRSSRASTADQAAQQQEKIDADGSRRFHPVR